MQVTKKPQAVRTTDTTGAVAVPEPVRVSTPPAVAGTAATIVDTIEPAPQQRPVPQQTFGVHTLTHGGRSSVTSPQFARFNNATLDTAPKLPAPIDALKFSSSAPTGLANITAEQAPSLLGELLEQSAAARKLMRVPATSAQGVAQFKALQSSYSQVFQATTDLLTKYTAGSQIVRGMVADRAALPDALIAHHNSVVFNSPLPPDDQLKRDVEIAWHLSTTEPEFIRAFVATSIAVAEAEGVAPKDIAKALVGLARLHGVAGDAAASDEAMTRALALDPRVGESSAPAVPVTRAARPAKPRTSVRLPQLKPAESVRAPTISLELPGTFAGLKLPPSLNAPKNLNAELDELLALSGEARKLMRSPATSAEGVAAFQKLVARYAAIFDAANPKSAEELLTKYEAGFQAIRALVANREAIPEALIAHHNSVVFNSALPPDDQLKRDIDMAWQMAGTEPKFARAFAETSLAGHEQYVGKSDLATALAGLARLQAAVGDKKEALKSLDRAFSLDSRNESAHALSAALSKE